MNLIESHVIGGIVPAFHSAKLTQDVEGRGLNPDYLMPESEALIHTDYFTYD